MTALAKHYYTPEEYLALEVKAEYKSQYVAGEIFAMAGNDRAHVVIGGNITGELRNRFRGTGCLVFGSDMRVAAASGDLCTYPDASALCGKAKFDETFRPETLTNPQVIFDVLSSTTESFDRGDKFARYRRLESLNEYVLIASDQIRVEHYVRVGAAEWNLHEYSRIEDVLPLSSVGCELPLAEIYYQVEFRDERSES